MWDAQLVKHFLFVSSHPLLISIYCCATATNLPRSFSLSLKSFLFLCRSNDKLEINGLKLFFDEYKKVDFLEEEQENNNNGGANQG